MPSNFDRMYKVFEDSEYYMVSSKLGKKTRVWNTTILAVSTLFFVLDFCFSFFVFFWPVNWSSRSGKWTNKSVIGCDQLVVSTTALRPTRQWLPARSQAGLCVAHYKVLKPHKRKTSQNLLSKFKWVNCLLKFSPHSPHSPQYLTKFRVL